MGISRQESEQLAVFATQNSQGQTLAALSLSKLYECGCVASHTLRFADHCRVAKELDDRARLRFTHAVHDLMQQPHEIGGILRVYADALLHGKGHCTCAHLEGHALFGKRYVHPPAVDDAALANKQATLLQLFEQSLVNLLLNN